MTLCVFGGALCVNEVCQCLLSSIAQPSRMSGDAIERSERVFTCQPSIVQPPNDAFWFFESKETAQSSTVLVSLQQPALETAQMMKTLLKLFLNH